jgi:RNA polymerase sigma-70 factor (ECF subfamily)
LSSAAAGESGGLAQLGTSYTPALRAFFSRRAHTDDVDDLIQEVLLRIQKRKAGGAVDNYEGYLFEVAANVLIDRSRRDKTRRRREHCELTEFDHPVDDISPERVLQGREKVARILNALNELPDRTRHVFVLARFEGLSYKDIAKRFGISVSAVEKHVMKAFRHLTERLRNEEGPSPARGHRDEQRGD